MRCSRRAFVAGLAAAALAPRVLAGAPRRSVGWLAPARWVEGIVGRLAPLGFVAGENLRMESREAARDARALEAAAAELVAAKPDALVTWNRLPLAALQRATQTIPIVCAGVADPVGYGFARSLRRPGGNITGLSYGKPEIAEIQVALVKAVLPAVRRLMLLVPDDASDIESAERGLFAAAASAGMGWDVTRVGTEADVERAFAGAQPGMGRAVYVREFRQPVFGRIVELSLRHRMPTIGAQDDEPVELGMLMSYWLDYADYLGRIASMLAAVLRGARPAETPFELPDRTHFVVNRRTAAAIGLTLPPEVMLRATRVIG